jgi:hypothetical protein
MEPEIAKQYPFIPLYVKIASTATTTSSRRGRTHGMGTAPIRSRYTFFVSDQRSSTPEEAKA